MPDWFRKFPPLVFSIIVCASCTVEIVSGGLDGINIGMTKQEVFDALRKRNDVDHVLPKLRNRITVNSGNLEDIEKLSGNGRIIILGPRFNANVYFIDGRVENIREAPINKGEDIGIRIGMSMEDFLVAMRPILKNRRLFRMFNAVKNSRWIVTRLASDVDDDDREFLFSKDAWRFSETEGYSITLLHFDEGRLGKIIYSYIPFEIP
ncbi:MAG: hypothetical protein IIA72_04190 [Proteobacteria bacterium]|nr:hypothetical protein [Pseudomonadota bacterium]